MERIEKVVMLAADAQKYGLENREILMNYSPTELAERYNGIGPEAFPGWLRGMVTTLHPTLEVVALIHDVEWSRSDGSREAFHQSNARFARNGRRMADARYGWYHPLRWVVRRQAERFANLCEWFGWTAWKSATQPENQ